MSLPVKTPETDKDLNSKPPPSDEPSALALLTSDDNQLSPDPESTPVPDPGLTDGNPESTLSGANPNPNLNLNLNLDITPNPILEQNPDHTIGAQALLPSTSPGSTSPSCKPNQSSLDPGLLLSNLQSKPNSPTQALKILRICQTPTSTHSTLPPTNLLPTQNSPSVASSIQHFDSLDTQAQTLPRRNSQSSPLTRIEEALNDIKADNKEFKENNAQNAETLKKHSITLTTHGTSLAALLEAQNKQQLEINQLKESNSTLVQDLMDQTLRITQLEETIEALMNTTEGLTSQNQTQNRL